MLVPIGAADIKEYHGEQVPVKARLYANKSFKTSEGVFVHNGHQDDPQFYQEFDLTYDGQKVRIEAGDAYSTSDSDQPDATYDLDAYDNEGSFLFHIFSRLNIVPPLIPKKPDDDFNDGVLNPVKWGIFQGAGNFGPSFSAAETAGKLHLTSADSTRTIAGSVRSSDLYNFTGRTIQMDVFLDSTAKASLVLTDSTNAANYVQFDFHFGTLSVAVGTGQVVAAPHADYLTWKIHHDQLTNTWVFSGFRAGDWEPIYTSTAPAWSPVSVQVAIGSQFQSLDLLRAAPAPSNDFDNLVSDITDTALLSTTWEAIVEDSKAVKMKYPPTYMSTEIIERRFAELTNTAPRSSSTRIGTTMLDVDPDDLSMPIAVGVNSPLLHIGGALADVGTYGRTRLDVAPINPADPVAVGSNSPLITRHLNGYANLTAAIAAGPGIIAITQPLTVSADTTVPPANPLNITGLGQITVAAGVSLTIGSMLDPGMRQVFTLTDANSHVLFSPAAVGRLNIAWFAGQAGGDCTRAVTECLASCVANGGEVYWPNPILPWTTLGGHIIPSCTILRGAGPHVDATYNSKILLASGAAGFMFKMQEGCRNVSLRDITLDAGAITTANLFWGNNLTGSNSISTLEFSNVNFHGSGDGAVPQVLFDSPVNALLTDVMFDHCFWITGANTSSVKGATNNLDTVFVQPNFLLGAGATAIEIAANTQINLYGPSFGGSMGSLSPVDTVQRTITQASIATGTNALSIATGNFTQADVGQRVVIAGKLDSYITDLTGPTTATVHDNATATATNAAMDVYRATPNAGMAKACIRITGFHGEININGSQDEGVQYFILAESGSGGEQGLINVHSSLVQSMIKTNVQMSMNSVGNRYWSNTFTTGPGGFNSVTSAGDLVLPYTLQFTRQIAHPKLVDSESGLTHLEQTTRNWFTDPSHVARMPQEFKFMNHDWSVNPGLTLPVVAIGAAAAFDKPLLRLGTLDSNCDLFTDYYEARRRLDTGHLKWSGNHPAASGFDFFVTDEQGMLIENSALLRSIMTLSHQTSASPNIQLRFRANGTDKWSIGTYADVFSIYNLGLNADAIQINEANNVISLDGDVIVLTGSTVVAGGDAVYAGLNIRPHAGDPSSPNDGDIWYNSTTGKFRGRAAGVNVDLS